MIVCDLCYSRCKRVPENSTFSAMGDKRGRIQALFSEHACVNVCAPMVRYSKLPFRSLVSKYNVCGMMMMVESSLRIMMMLMMMMLTLDCC